MTSQLTTISSDLKEKVPNVYALVLEVAEIAKRLLDDQREKRMGDPFPKVGNANEKVIPSAIIMKSSEVDIGDGLIG